MSTQPPVIKLTFPASFGDYNTTGWSAGCAPAGYCGSATDPARVTQVQVSIQQLSSLKFWNGTAFSSPSQVFATTTLGTPGGASTSWQYGFSSSNFPIDGIYTVAVRGTDSLGHQTALGHYASAIFVIDRVAPPSPVLIEHPDTSTTSTSAHFDYRDGEPFVSFFCKLDSGAFARCGNGNHDADYSGLSVGTHQFQVIACDAAGNCSSPTVFNWTITGKVSAFSIGNASGFLTPGAPGLSINLVIANPFSTKLTVTSVLVTVTGTSASGCTAGNFIVMQNLVGSVTIPAGMTESLSAAGVPSIDWPKVQMIDTHLNQDACEGATVNLSYAGNGTQA